MERSIDVTAAVAVPFARARAALAADPVAILAGEPAPGRRRFRLELHAASDSRLTQEVEVNLGAVDIGPDMARCGLTWRAVRHPELFPVFAGDVELRPVDATTEVRLRGQYRLPFGAVGRYGDALVGHRLARRVLGQLVGDIARRLEEAAVAA